MSSSKKNFLLEFTDVTQDETKAINNLIRHPHYKDQANTNNNFHAAVLAFFYRKRKGENDSFSQNMRVSIFKMFLYLWPVRASIWRCSFLPYVELYENFRFTERLVFQRKTVQLS